MDDATDAVIERIWARDAKKDDYAHLGIDEFLFELFKNQRWHISVLLDRAKSHVRRAMEVGYLQVLYVRHESPGSIADDFEFLEDKAKAAHEALDKLLKHLEPRARAPADLARPILTAQAGLQTGTAQALHERSMADALVLWRQNPGKPEHRIFAATLSEMWIFLTGKRPGTNPAHDKNPFLRFVTAAWIDVFGHDENSEDPAFVGALTALSFSDYQNSQITSKGPDWI